MLYIGCHLSFSKGFASMGKEALSIGANTFQFFTRNPRGAKAKALDVADITALWNILQENHFAPVVAHAPYTMNACSSDPHIRDLAQQMMSDDVQRLEYLPGTFYNFHPGSHVGQGIEVGIEQISNTLNQVLFSNQKTIVLLETMAGKGSEIGATFEQLRSIMDKVTLREKLGVCLDTCHVFDAGYDIVHHLDSVLQEFDRIIGLKHLKAIHLNDSLNSHGSHKDRHAKIGEGFIGASALAAVVSHPALHHLPFILETPNDLAGYKKEIDYFRQIFSDEL